MRRVATPRPIAPRRAGKYLIMLAWILPVVFGMTGLTIDAGTLLAVRRQAQNSADAAALAVAEDLLRGTTTDSGYAADGAQTYVRTLNGLSNATVVAHVGPSSGPYANNPHFVEVTVTTSVTTFFIQLLNLLPGSEFNIGSAQDVSARAVAGFEAATVPHQITLLSPNSVDDVHPGGLDFTALPLQPDRLVVPGGIAVNSEGGLPGGASPNGVAVRTRNSEVRSPNVQVVGSVDSTSSFKSLTGDAANAPHTGSLPVADPLYGLPTPTTSNGVVNSFPGLNGTTYNTPQAISLAPVAGQQISLNPGIYSSIQILQGSGGTVTFNPGIYVLQGGTGGTALSIDTAGTVVGKGVMFYNTGSDYDPVTGGPDAADEASGGGSMGTATSGNININARTLELSGLDSSSSKFEGMLFYQRRASPARTVVSARPRNVLAGTIYSKGGQVQLNGATNYKIEVIAGSMVVGKADIIWNLDFAQQNAYRPLRVFLVE
jgi:Flp pilus assembly protein TadG